MSQTSLCRFREVAELYSLGFALPIFHLSGINPSTAVKAHFIATMPDLFSPASGGANTVTRFLEGSRFGKIRWLLSIKSFYLE